MEFEVKLKSVEEVYPVYLKADEIPDFLAELKASVFTDLNNNDILITSDTIVWHKNKALGKPSSPNEAFEMLRELSGNSHQVITSVCFTTLQQQITVNEVTNVWFKELTDQEIQFYIDNHHPFDKAGAYGIQEWIGAIGVTRIEGSYNNVMGLPTALVYKTLMELAAAKI